MTLDAFRSVAAASRQRVDDVKGLHKRVVEWALLHAESDLTRGVSRIGRSACRSSWTRRGGRRMR